MKSMMRVAVIAALAIGTSAIASAQGATVVDDAIWVDGRLYGTVVTPATFKPTPPSQSTDVIYNFAMSGLSGQRSVAEAAPGDRDYNGGRWSVKMVVFTALGLSIHDPDGDGVANFELQSEEMVQHHEVLGHLNIYDTEIYFECPLRPRR